MAKTEKNTTATENNTAPVAGFQLPEGFQDLGLDRFLYKAESCRAKPLVGYLIGIQEFARDKADKKEWWDALIVRTTQPTLAVGKDDDGKEIVVDVGIGEEVMIPMTDKLEKLRGYAVHPDMMAEFFIQPIEKVVLETNKDGTPKKTMWRYKAGGKQPVPRVSATSWDNMPQVEAPKKNGAALPAAG